jgi:hypothetical protein
MMTKRWKIILGSIIAIVGLYCIAALVLIAKYGWAPARHAREVAGVGSFEYTGSADLCTIRVKKINGTTVDIHYEDKKATDKKVLHPKGHPLSGRVQPPADEKTLHEAT